jgi:hypothetical protein
MARIPQQNYIPEAQDIPSPSPGDALRPIQKKTPTPRGIPDKNDQSSISRSQRVRVCKPIPTPIELHLCVPFHAENNPLLRNPSLCYGSIFA